MGNEDIFKDFEKFKKGSDDKPKKMDGKEIHIHLKLNKAMLERAIYWVIILVLLVIVFFNPISNLVTCSCNTTVESGETVQAGDAEITDVEETTEEEPEETTTEEEDEEEDVSLSGNVNAAISKILFETDDEDNPHKVTEVQFSIDNQKSDFRPKIEIYWYGDDDIDEMKNLLRASATFPTLLAGTSKDYKITKFVSKYISGGSESITLFLKIYNADSGKKLKEVSKDIE